MESLLQNEGPIRLVIFFGLFSLFATVEFLFPARKRSVSQWLRWRTNLGLTAFNTIVLRILFPTAAVGVAYWAQKEGIGLFHYLELSQAPLIIFLGVIIFDALIYFQHRIFHVVPIFWKLHQVHHADPDFDVTTGSRFHPIEIILSMMIKVAFILILGPAPAAIILFEIILSSMALFNHGNFRLPKAAETLVRSILVTPDMHRIHHSKIERETNSNYGFNLSIWDRIFGSYTHRPALGDDGLNIGLSQWETTKDNSSFLQLLIMPFKK